MGVSGNVGIGIAPSATYKVNVSGSLNATSVFVNGTAVSGSRWGLTPSTNNIFYNTGNVGIGTNSATNIFQIGSGNRFKIANNNTDFSIIGTNDGGGANNTRINIYGSAFSGYTGNIEYVTTTSTGSHRFATGGLDERMRISANGVGIGTNNPLFMLEVGAGTGSTGSISQRYFNGATALTLGTITFANVSMKVNGTIWATATITTSSDSRIKEDIQDINDDSALQSILAIEPKTYKYIDKIAKGDKKVYGFIAQQIRAIIPEATSIQTSYIPNIMVLADYDNEIITLPSQPTKVIIKLNDKIRCYDKDNKIVDVEVIEIIDDLSFKIKEIEYTDNKIYVYGTEIDDFHTLDKSYIYTLNVCATQELHRRIISQDERIKELEEKVERLLYNISI